MNGALALPLGGVPRLKRPRRCESCGCVALQPNGVNLECRRNPPTLITVPTGIVSAFPGVQPDQWCKSGWCAKVEIAG